MNTITESALKARINRRLASDGERLIVPKEGSSDDLQYGPAYIVDGNKVMQRWNLHLDDLGRELGVLHEGEVLS
jgi:hypothetical protein